MKLTVVGCSGSLPGPNSPASCYLVRSEHQGRTWSLLLDLGSGALGPLQRHIGLCDIDGIALSHLHPDHCMDLCGLYVAQKYHPGQPTTRRIPVWGPAGAAERLHRAYDDLPEPDGLATAFDFRDLGDGQAFTLGPFRVTAYRVRHPVEAYGLRVEADGAALAYTGDTDACDALQSLCRDATLVLTDSAFVDGRDQAEGVHLSGRRAAQAALDAGAQRLMLTHLPPWNDPQVCRAQAAAVWPGEVELAEPGASYPL
ncbi:MAG TPA: MBL fold metallo-hydrolase [Dermatophilaceae bacterium]|nr:MBL fold metallo-hydrolase [Dermatophilaceae bacterium]